MKLAFGGICLFLAQILKKRIVQRKDNVMSAEIYMKNKASAANDASLKSAIVTVGFENQSIYAKKK